MARLRAEHLLSRGLRRFASLTFLDDRAEEIELHSFESTLKEAGFTCDTIKLPADSGTSLPKWRKMQKVINLWMDRWKLPIGVFVGAEMPGRLVAQECLQRGWRVPEDVAIITGRNEEALCESPRPTLSSIEVGFERQGYEAARLLDQLMNGKKPPSGPLLIPPLGVVIRESTDFFAVDDETVTAALKYISQNAHRNIGPDDVARSIAVESRTLHRRFQKHLNRPVAREILRVRLERAKRELVQGKRSMEEIARAVGFGGAMRMCDIFRRELGVSPRQFRKERQ
jgi:LacI family transcriptional regulator